MAKQLHIKNRHIERRLYLTRAIAGSAIVLLLLLALLSRLFYLQVIQHRYYSTQSTHNLLNTIPIAPNRGLIFDRNNTLLAKNISTESLDILPEKVTNLSHTISELTKLINVSSSDVSDFYHRLKSHRPYQPVPLTLDLSQAQAAKFYVNRYRFPGVSIAAHLQRSYPAGTAISHVIGYVGRINGRELAAVDATNYSATHYIGKVGVEKYFEPLLHGTVGNAEAEINANGQIVRHLRVTPPIPGDNIYLTIDNKLQQVAEQAFAKDQGALVAIDPNNGQILAMVSAPGFNPNLFANGISEADYDRLLHSPDKPLYNRAIHGQFAPGSTVKPFIALFGLATHEITPSLQIFDPGWFRIPGTKHIYHDWKLDGHGWVNVVKAITVSCDTYFYHLANKLGIAKLDQLFDAFGFGQKTDIQMPNEAKGIVPTPAWKKAYRAQTWFSGDTVEAGIGQGFMLVTPLQLAQAVATIASRGKMYQPTLLLKTRLPNGQFLINKPILKQIIHLPAADWRLVIHAMAQVINAPDGTGWHFGRHADYTVAAKTGTAQIYGHHRDEDHTELNIPKRLRNNHLFIAFAPISHPKIALAVVVEHDDRAAIVARKVMDYYFDVEQANKNTKT